VLGDGREEEGGVAREEAALHLVVAPRSVEVRRA
jgi:hypothetical protein